MEDKSILEKKIQFVCISDTHNQAQLLNLPKGDVLIHAGDFTNSGLPQKIAYNYCNHDLTFDIEDYTKNLAARFHQKQKVAIDPVEAKSQLKDQLRGYSIYGTPFTPTFKDWAFNLNLGEPLQKKWEQIPNNTDILITHGPPHKILDRCWNGQFAGSPDLRKTVLERVKPKYHIFGHIHEASGQEKLDETTFINVSSIIIKRKLSTTQPIFTFSLPIKD